MNNLLKYFSGYDDGIGLVVYLNGVSPSWSIWMLPGMEDE